MKSLWYHKGSQGLAVFGIDPQTRVFRVLGKAHLIETMLLIEQLNFKIPFKVLDKWPRG